MTVTIDPVDAVVLPRSMTLEQWSRLDVERPVELVEGVPVMSPFESAANIRAVMRLVDLLSSRCDESVVAYPHLGVVVSDAPARATVRFPDLLVTHGEADPESVAVNAGQVALAVEIVSPSSVERDWVTKRAEYARAGVPAYLVVDRAVGSLVLFDRIEDGRYVDAAPATEVVLTIGGATVPIGLADLTG